MNIKKFIEDINKKGIPTPMLRDPKTGQGSITATLVFLSSLYVQIALLNSFAQIFKGVDTVNALYWFGMCLSAYLGRKIISVEKKE